MSVAVNVAQELERVRSQWTVSERKDRAQRAQAKLQWLGQLLQESELCKERPRQPREVVHAG